MQTLRQDKHAEHVWRHLQQGLATLVNGDVRKAYPRLSVASHDSRETQKIQNSEDVLCKLNVTPSVRDLIQDSVDVDVSRWIDKGPCAAVDL